MENWQSEYLQFVVFVMASVWLVQKGSTESQKVDQAGSEMVIFSVYLRQRGSSQSKPVGAPHHATAEEG